MMRGLSLKFFLPYISAFPCRTHPKQPVSLPGGFGLIHRQLQALSLLSKIRTRPCAFLVASYHLDDICNGLYIYFSPMKKKMFKVFVVPNAKKTKVEKEGETLRVHLAAQPEK